jgi:hypothetical protein
VNNSLFRCLTDEGFRLFQLWKSYVIQRDDVVQRDSGFGPGFPLLLFLHYLQHLHSYYVDADLGLRTNSL